LLLWNANGKLCIADEEITFESLMEMTEETLKSVVPKAGPLPHDLYQFGNDNIKGIQFFWVTKESVDQHINDFGFEDRYSSAKTVSGTRSHHAFVPLSKSIIMMHRISSDTFGTTAVVTDSYHSEPEEVGSDETHLDPAAYQPGQYIAAVYDQKWYIGVIRSDEAEDIQVKFMTSTL